MPARQYTARRLHLGCCACLLLLVSYRPLARFHRAILLWSNGSLAR